MANHARRSRCVEKIRVVLEPATDSVRLFPEVKRQVELGRTVLDG